MTILFFNKSILYTRFINSVKNSIKNSKNSAFFSIIIAVSGFAGNTAANNINKIKTVLLTLKTAFNFVIIYANEKDKGIIWNNTTNTARLNTPLLKIL